MLGGMSDTALNATDLIVVTTIACGKGMAGQRDYTEGGDAPVPVPFASFDSAADICYSEASDALIVPEEDSSLETDEDEMSTATAGAAAAGGTGGGGDHARSIQCVLPATQKRKSSLERALTSALMENSALPLQPLLSIIRDFAISVGTVYRYAVGCVMSSVRR